MKKDSEEEQKPLFQIWLEAYNSHLLRVAQRSSRKDQLQSQPNQREAPEAEPPPGSNA
jgi:hypothetical protein